MGESIQRKTGICGLCGKSCLVEAEVSGNRILSVEKGKHPYLKGQLCTRGAALKQFVHHRDRIEQPMKRVGERGSGEYVPISWDEAINEIAQRLNRTKEESGAKATVFYAGHPKWYRKVLAELCAEYGSPNFCTESSTCNSAMRIAWGLVCGPWLTPDTARCKTLLIWSANPGAQDGSNDAVEQPLKRGAKVIVVDPRVTVSANAATLHLQPYPGTDGAVALAMAQVIISEGLEDREFIRKYTEGFEEYSRYVSVFTPEYAEKISGVPAGKIREAAHILAEGGVSLRHSSCSTVHGINGVQNMRAIILLLALTGSLGRAGCNGGAAEGPKAALDNFHHALPQRPDMENDISGGEFPVWNELLNNECQCIHLARAILEEKPYKVRNLIAFGMNAGMWPESDRILEALKKVEFSVVTELFWNEACALADIVLPACAAPERDHVLIGKKNRVVLVEHFLDPGEKLPDIEIMLRIAHALGAHGRFLDLPDYEAYLNYIIRNTGVTLDELKANPDGVDAQCVTESRAFDPATGFTTPSGKVEFVSNILRRYSEVPGCDPLPVYRDWRDCIEGREEYPLALVAGGRKVHLFHSRTFRMSWLSGLETHTLAEISPADAEKLGVKNGDRVTLFTPKGSMEYTAAVDGGIMPGVVHVYHDDGEQNVNRIIDENICDPLSGFPCFRSYGCRIEKIS